MNISLVKNKEISFMSILHKGRFIRLKQKRQIIALILLALSFNFNATNAQNLDSIAQNFNIDLNLKNMHLWQGFVVTPGVMAATSMEYRTTDQKYVLGIWGGASFDGTFKEFSYYTKYNFTNNLYLQAVSHNNYSNDANPDIFSYNKHTSPNFIDIGLGYTLSENFPLKAYWATILFGNDQDYQINEDGTETDSYSNYVELSYRLYKTPNTQLGAFIGGAFSFITEKTYFSESPNIVNFGITLNQEIKINSWKIPVTGTAFWNPESGVGALQLDILLF